jgi:hypothetical protein
MPVPGRKAVKPCRQEPEDGNACRAGKSAKNGDYQSGEQISNTG